MGNAVAPAELSASSSRWTDPPLETFPACGRPAPSSRGARLIKAGVDTKPGSAREPVPLGRRFRSPGGLWLLSRLDFLPAAPGAPVERLRPCIRPPGDFHGGFVRCALLLGTLGTPDHRCPKQAKWMPVRRRESGAVPWTVAGPLSSPASPASRAPRSSNSRGRADHPCRGHWDRQTVASSRSDNQ